MEGECVINVIGNVNIICDVKYIILGDIFVFISYFFNLLYKVGDIDDIDYLGNCRLCFVGELL